MVEYIIDYGRLYENCVFLELKRRLPPNQEINYWKNKKGLEVDFFIREGFSIRELIQVTYSLFEIKTEQREINGLVACALENHVDSGLIITKDVEKSVSVENVKIQFIPLIKWLLA